MKVKITRCESPSFWYSDKVGQTFEVKQSTFDPDKFHLIGDTKFISKWNCEIIEEQKPSYDEVDKPEHYHRAGIDPITVMKHTFTKEEYAGFARGNALKYLMRYKDKGGFTDLKKARFYINELIEWEGE